MPHLSAPGVLLLTLLLAPSGAADVQVKGARAMVPLPGGNLLLTDGGEPGTGANSRVIEVTRAGRLVNAWLFDLDHGHSAVPTTPGNVLVTDTAKNRVVEVDSTGTEIWDSDDVAPFSDGSTLDWPNDAKLLESGDLLITDRTNHRFFVMDRAGTILWQFGETGVNGSDDSHLAVPHNADPLPGGNWIVADSGNDRILEIDASGAVVWSYGPTGSDSMQLPRDADRLPNGNTLITDTQRHRVIEVDPAGTVVWSLDGVVGYPYEADRLPNGNTLVADGTGTRWIEVDPAGTIVWSYPGTVPVIDQQVWITNPTSGVDLFTHIHMPADAGPDNRYPLLLHVPGGNADGSRFHSPARAQAAEGYVVVHFDPDGRGNSTNGGTYTEENYAGFLHQDGLKAVLDHAVALPEVDNDSVGIYSHSYGITMASGMLARYPDQPPVRFLVDWEGPADRYDTAAAHGGHVPHPPDDDVFWSEREAVNFLPEALVQYQRIQTERDHNANITDNHHAIALSNAATHSYHGGTGISIWTRINRSFDNPDNTSWTVGAPATWLPEDLEPHGSCIDTLMLHERDDSPTMTVSGNLMAGGDLTLQWSLGEALKGSLYLCAFSFGDGPTWIPGATTLHLDLDLLFQITFFISSLDSTGSAAVATDIPANPAVAGTYHAQAMYLHTGSATGLSATTGVEVVITP